MSDSNVNGFTESIKNSTQKQIDEIHTSMPGVIQSYDINTGLANVKPSLDMNIDGERVGIPIITGVPIIFPGGMAGDVSITWPIENGDECLLIFSESQIDEWLLEIESNDTRRFDLTDAIAIPGLSKKGYKALKDNPRDLTIRYKKNYIKLGDSIEIKGNVHIIGQLTSTG